MKAFVMAAGAGTRLRPLTFTIPKPMVPIVNKPVLEHTLDNLALHGITEIVMNLHHHPELIRDYFADKRFNKFSIHYSFENKLMGTAGGVKKAEKYFDDTFVVMSGDGLTDIDLKKAVKFHKKNKALATMVLKPVESRFEYGVTLLDKHGKIKQFIEKPLWSEVFANTVNTGIYIFEPEIFSYIPKEKFYDFGNQVWPDLLKMKKKIFGYVMNEFWTDVGNLGEYKKAIKDVLERKIKIKIPGKQLKNGVWIGAKTKISASAVLRPPCVIGDCCEIGKNAIIGPHTVISTGAKISAGAKISNSILWENVIVKKNVKLDNCIIGNKAKVTEDITVFEGTVINIE